MKVLKNISLSVMTGILLSLSWPEIGNQAWLIFIAFIPLFAAVEKLENWRTGFLYSFLSFFIWHIFSCWWMWPSTPIGSLSAWLINSLLMASVTTLAKFSSLKLKRIPFEIILAFYWLGFEIFHLFWDLKWPWMNLGHAFANHTDWIQWFEYSGVYGGTFWVIIVNGVIFRLNKYMINIFSFAPSTSNDGNKKMIALFILTSALIISPVLLSKYLLKQNLSSSGTLEVTIIQPNIDTYNEKFDVLTPLDQSEKLIHQIQRADSNSIILLPETAIPESFYLSDAFPQSIDTLLKVAKRKHLRIVGGYYIKDQENLYNSACFIEEGEIIETRNKIKLLAYAEKIPFDFISGKWSQLVHEQGGAEKSYGTDHTAQVFSVIGSTKVGTLICFESVFSDITTEMCRNGAQVIFIITNDDWWFDTPGHRQHFAFARIKAIESRKWIARSANTGISGIINAKGEVVNSTEYRKEAIVEGEVLLNTELTFFSQYEKHIRIIIISVSILLLFTSILIKKIQNILSGRIFRKH